MIQAMLPSSQNRDISSPNSFSSEGDLSATSIVVGGGGVERFAPDETEQMAWIPIDKMKKRDAATP